MTDQHKAFLCAGGTVLAWSTVSAAFKIALAGMTPVQLVFTGMSVAALFLAAFLLVRGGREAFRLPADVRPAHLVLPGVLLHVYYILLFTAYDRLPAQIAQPVNYAWAIILALLSARILKQKLPAREIACLLAAWAGVAVLAAGGTGSLGPIDAVGLACVLAGAVLYAVYWIICTRSPLPQEQGLLSCFSVAAALSGLTLALGGDGPPPLPALPAGIYVGLFELGIPFLLWGTALRLSESAARIAALPFLTPFLALFWIAMVLGEPIAPSTPAGLALIVGGTFLQQRLAARRTAG